MAKPTLVNSTVETRVTRRPDAKPHWKDASRIEKKKSEKKTLLAPSLMPMSTTYQATSAQRAMAAGMTGL
jgi:hypothetical protein